MCVCACAHITANVGCLPQLLPTLFFETEAVSEPRAHHFVQTGWLQTPGILMSLSPQYWNYGYVQPHLALKIIYFCMYGHT